VKILVTGDWHLGVTQYGVALDNGINSRLSDTELLINKAINLAIEEKIDLFVCAGDIFHTNKPAQHEQRAFWRILQKLSKQEFFTRFIIGNHDHNSKYGSNHALRLFQDIFDSSDNIKIYDQTAWERFDGLDIENDSLLVCWYPYHAEPPDWADMQSFGGVGATALVCHSHLEGAVVGAEPFEIKDDKATRFSQLPVDFVWAGHFHKPQLLCKKPLAFYPGSINCVDFNERNDVKGVVLVDTVKRSYECVGFHTRKFIQIDLDNRVSFVEGDLCDVEESIIKVNVNIDESLVGDYDESILRRSLADAGVHSIAAINLNINKTKIVRDKDCRIDNSLSDNLKRFVANNDYGSKSDSILKMGLEVIEHCCR